MGLLQIQKMIDSKAVGELGENIAARYLTNSGYAILEKNYTCKFGEIDIIAKKGTVLAFVEVKTRTNISYGYPEEAVNKYKIKKIKNTANFFIVNNKPLQDFNFRFDVISIIADKKIVENAVNANKIKNSVGKKFCSADFNFKHIKDAF
mgnify:CR=1 FL=1